MTEKGGLSRRGALWLPLVSLLACASVLRAPISVVPPLASDLSAELGMSAAQVGLLTSIPLLCFGVLTPLTSRVLQRRGIFRSTLIGLGLIIAGSAARSAGGMFLVFAGTILIGVGISIGNLAVPMLIGRRFPTRVAAITGAYSATINVAVTACTALAVPMAVWGGWRWSTALWGVGLGIVAAVLWILARMAHRRSGRPPETAAVRVVARGVRPRWTREKRRLVLLLVVAFSGHTFSYYAISAWLPTALAQMLSLDASAAGQASSVFQLAGIVGPFLVPFLMSGLDWSRTRTVFVVSAAWLVLPVLLLVAPSWWLVGSIISGAAQGAFFTAIFVIIIEDAGGVDDNRRISTWVQSVGYTVAALAPVALGWLHEAVAGWMQFFLVVLAVLVVMTLAAVLAARPRDAT